MDRFSISLSGTNWNPVGTLMQRAIKAGYTKFYYDGVDKYIIDGGKRVKLEDLFPEKEN